jgi:hypothetical protein
MGSRADKLGQNILIYDKNWETVTTVTNTGSSIENRTKIQGGLNGLTISDI